jgi:hypothetical protein
VSDIKDQLSIVLAKKIFGNSKVALEYLKRLNTIKKINGITSRTLTRGSRVGLEVLGIDSDKDIWEIVFESWDYESSKKIIRDIFKEGTKYRVGVEADVAMGVLIKEWETLSLGKIEWPFSQGDFDGFVQGINNSSDEPGVIKDEKVKAAAVKYRRIKEINTVRNDFIETLIFGKNENIIPTLSHRRGVDFFIDGVPFDQKVAKSPTNQFKAKFGDSWKIEAIKNPALVAEYLYKYQDEGRFGADPRLLVVYLDEDISIQKIREILGKINLSEPIEIEFSFDHEIGGMKNYKTKCFVILLYN